MTQPIILIFASMLLRSVILFVVYHVSLCCIFLPLLTLILLLILKFAANYQKHCQKITQEFFPLRKMTNFSLICDGLRLIRITIGDWEGSYLRTGTGMALVRV